jgi:DME family drug/metabolite transporter
MNRGGWGWVVCTLVFFQLSDIALRLSSVRTHFAVGTVLQAVPLLLAASIVAIRGGLAHRLRRRRASAIPPGQRGSSPPPADARTEAELAPTARGRSPLPARAWLAAAAYGGLQFFAGNMLFYAAMQQGGLSIASPSVQSQAIWAVVLGGVLLGERISRTMFGGIALFVVGLAVLAWFKSAGGAALPDGWLGGLALGLGGGLAWAGASAVQRTLLRGGMPLSAILAVGALTGVLLLNVLIALVFGLSVWATAGDGAGLYVLGAGCLNGMAVFSISQALRTFTISKVIPVVSLSIVFNTIVGKLVFGEYVNAGSIIGMLLVFAGVVLVQEPGKQARAAA